jgi:hypothetical protein
MNLQRHAEYDIYTIQATPEEQQHLIQHIVYTNGCPAISPIIIDDQAYWHANTLHRAGINPEEYTA